MIRGFYTARSGLIAHQEHMNVLSNNLANVNTTAFKPMRTAFKDLLYQNINRPEAQDTAMSGAGLKVNKNDLLMGSGSMVPTERELDFALEDANSFFMLESGDEVLYTRAGNFYMSNEDDTFYLVAGDGSYVLDEDGGRIEIEIDASGKALIDPTVIGVTRFPNPYALEALGDNRYAATLSAGEPVVLEEPVVIQSYLEGSAVEISNEMANVVIASKAFSLNARMVQVADEVEQTINTLR